MHPPSWCIHHHDVSIIMMHPSSWCIHHHDASIIMMHPSPWCIHHHDASISMMQPSSWCIHHPSSWESPRSRSHIAFQSSRSVQVNPLAWKSNVAGLLACKKTRQNKEIKGFSILFRIFQDWFRTPFTEHRTAVQQNWPSNTTKRSPNMNTNKLFTVRSFAEHRTKHNKIMSNETSN